MLFTACSEQNPPGVDLGGLIKAVDSSYTAPIEARQDKVVLVEELTGVQCVNCVEAANIVKTISNDNPGRILTVASHPFGGASLTKPITGKSKFDFRLDEVDEIMTILGGYPNLPAASIDRGFDGGDYYNTAKGTWINDITAQLNVYTPVNIHLTSTYNKDRNSCELVVKTAFTENYSEELYLTVYIIENEIKDYQSVPETIDPSGYQADYKHMHVFRDCITSVSGSSLNFADKKAGTVLQKILSFNPVIDGNNAWNLDNCKVLALVHKSGTDKTVLQTREIDLK